MIVAIIWSFLSIKYYISSIGGNTRDHNCAQKWALDFSPTGNCPTHTGPTVLCQMGILYWYSIELLFVAHYSIVLGVIDSLWVFQFSQI